MSTVFSLADSQAIADLQTYFQRASRVDDGATRLIAGSRVLAAYTAILYPRGLLDHSPTVLGLRTLALAGDDEFDSVVPMRSLLDRLARAAERAAAADAERAAAADAALAGDGPAAGAATDVAPVQIGLPLGVSTVTWAGISPPRGGWYKVGETSAALLERTARAGIDEVAEAVPTGTGEQLVQRVRGEVWGRPVEGTEDVPSGVAFGALSLGFVSELDEVVPVFESGPWTRLTFRRGHVLVRRQGWRLRA